MFLTILILWKNALARKELYNNVIQVIHDDEERGREKAIEISVENGNIFEHWIALSDAEQQERCHNFPLSQLL